MLVRTLIFLGSAAVGLLVAVAVIEGVNVTAQGFALVVIIYAVVQSIISPFLLKVAAKSATAFLGGVGLVATFLALLTATLVGNSLTISGGATTWIATTVVVWLVTAVATITLPFLLVKAGVQSARNAAVRPGASATWLPA